MNEWRAVWWYNYSYTYVSSRHFFPHFNVYYYLFGSIVFITLFPCIYFIVLLLFATYCLIAHRPFIFNRITQYNWLLWIHLMHQLRLLHYVIKYSMGAVSSGTKCGININDCSWLKLHITERARLGWLRVTS